MPPERILIARRTRTWQEPGVPMSPAPPPWRRKRVMLAAAALVVIALVGAIAFVALRKSDDSGATSALQATEGSTTVAANAPPSTVATPTTAGDTTVTPTTLAATRASDTDTDTATDTATATATDTDATTGATTAPAGTTSPAAATAVPATTVVGSAPASVVPDSAAPGPTDPPPTLPDGSWPPILAVFDVDQVTVIGWVPSQAASERLSALGTANSKTGAPVQNNTVVDPRVPANVGVRVVELTSTRFPAGSALVMPEHAAELNRVVNIMNALPNITMTVIGHADQRGTSDDNLKLSRQRAQAVVDYLVSQGINAERLASKAVGADEPLTQDTSDAAYALNRRTEFVFYGLLVGT
jgi:outer membrane protein OmpA-like peptidoglycan-associated protein